VANIGASEHRGVESYLELDPLRLIGMSPAFGALDLFSSLAYIDARYVSGEFAGNRVEQAPRVLARFGATYGFGEFSNTLQVSHTSASFGDANNSTRLVFSPRAESRSRLGVLIPARGEDS
jgi:Fe(3+) dicitrate transport protein